MQITKDNYNTFASFFHHMKKIIEPFLKNVNAAEFEPGFSLCYYIDKLRRGGLSKASCAFHEFDSIPVREAGNLRPQSKLILRKKGTDKDACIEKRENHPGADRGIRFG